MKNKFMKKTLAAALALTLVGGGLPTAIGGNGLSKPAIVADAASIGDVFNIGDELPNAKYFYSDTESSQFIDCKVDILKYNVDNSKIYICQNHLTDDMWLNVPVGRELEYPTGVKIASGDGDEIPYKLELVYSGEPMGAYEEVAVGKKWYIGDTINTNAYYSVPHSCIVNSPYGAYVAGGIESDIVQLYRKKLSAPVTYSAVREDPVTYNANTYGCGMFVDVTLGCAANNALGETDWVNDISFFGNYQYIKGIEVTGGEGTKDNPFTIEAIRELTLANGEYKQIADFDGTHYNRFVFVTDRSVIEGKSKAVFSATLNGNKKTFETSTYYTGVISNGDHITPASENSVMFVVTVSSTSSLDGLTCTLDFE